MTTLVIGSHALKALGLGNREPKDLDVFTNSTSPTTVPVDRFWHPEFEKVWDHSGFRNATLDELYTIKLSHSHWELPNGSWSKHVYDLVTLKDAGAKLDMGLYKILYKVWEEKHGSKKVDLTKEADDFFADAVKRKYDHDSIHYSVAYGDQPMYESILRDGHTVDVDPKKMWAMPHDDLVRLFREEILATALERIVIPRNYKVSPASAYFWALRRTVTSLTKGKSSRFLLDNIKDFVTPDPDYVQRHLDNAHKLIPLEM